MPITNAGRAKFDTAREMDFASIAASFTKIGTDFENQPRECSVVNFTDVILDISISYAGDSVCFSIGPNGGAKDFDITANGAGEVFTPSTGEAVWVKYRTGAPTSGFVQFTSILAV